MIPKKIYLTNKELQDTTTCERMVSINEPYRDMTEEYVNLSQVWHKANEEPNDGTHILMEHNYLDSKEFKSYNIDYGGVVNWGILKKYFRISRWAYISDLLPKQFGISEQLEGDEE